MSWSSEGRSPTPSRYCSDPFGPNTVQRAVFDMAELKRVEYATHYSSGGYRDGFKTDDLTHAGMQIFLLAGSLLS